MVTLASCHSLDNALMLGRRYRGGLRVSAFKMAGILYLVSSDTTLNGMSSPCVKQFYPHFHHNTPGDVQLILSSGFMYPCQPHFRAVWSRTSYWKDRTGLASKDRR